MIFTTQRRADFRVKSAVSVSAQDSIVALGKVYTLSAPSPQGCPRNSASVCLVEHRSFPILEGGMSATYFLHSSFLQAINAVMLWPVHVQKVLQASEHLCPAKLQTRCDICCACQSICLFQRAQDSRSIEVFVAEDCAWLCASKGSPFQTPPFAGGSLSL